MCWPRHLSLDLAHACKILVQINVLRPFVMIAQDFSGILLTNLYQELSESNRRLIRVFKMVLGLKDASCCFF